MLSSFWHTYSCLAQVTCYVKASLKCYVVFESLLTTATLSSRLSFCGFRTAFLIFSLDEINKAKKLNQVKAHCIWYIM